MLKSIRHLTAALICCAALVLTFSAAMAAEDDPLTGTCGTSLTWTLSADGTLTISGTGRMNNYSYFDPPWADYKSSIQTLIIEEGVTSVGTWAFDYCSQLDRIIFQCGPIDIGSYAFYQVTATVIYPSDAGWTTSDKANYGGTLTWMADDESLASGTCGADLTWDLTVSGCLTVSGTGEMDNFTDSGSPWYGWNDSIRTVQIGEGVTSVGDYAFSRCFLLTSVNLPSTLTHMGSTPFFCCTKLSDISVSSENNRYISENGVLFNRDQTQLICYPAGRTASSYCLPSTVTALSDYAFSGCALTSLTLPDGLSSIGSYCFYDCPSLEKMNLPDTLTSIGSYAFSRCPALADRDGFVIFNGTLYDYCGSAGELVIPDTVSAIADGVFRFNLTLTKVTIPDSVTTIGSYVLSNCFSLEQVILPSSFTCAGTYAFSDCPSLADENGFVIFNGVLYDYVAESGENDESGESGARGVSIERGKIVIPSSVTTIASHAFDSCDTITDVTIPSSVRTLGDYAFAHCSLLEQITFCSNAPDIGENTFVGVTATVVCPANNSTWTDAVKTQCGNTLTWQKKRMDGRQYIDGAWYFFRDGFAVAGWQTENGIWYYFKSNGTMATGWQKVGATWYYLDDSGAMVNGWQTINGTRYYFKPDGAMAAGWVNFNGNWHYFNPSGMMCTGWQKVGTTWYYLSESGIMQTGWRFIDGSWYYLNSDGAMAIGWRNLSGIWYYFRGNGAMATGWQKVGTTWYYLKPSGAMVNGWQYIGGVWYHFSPSGAMTTGWMQVGVQWYYLAPSGAMLTGTHVIDGVTRVFNSYGVWIS